MKIKVNNYQGQYFTVKEKYSNTVKIFSSTQDALDKFYGEQELRDELKSASFGIADLGLKDGVGNLILAIELKGVRANRKLTLLVQHSNSRQIYSRNFPAQNGALADTIFDIVIQYCNSILKKFKLTI